jgi:hypothetical protein
VRAAVSSPWAAQRDRSRGRPPDLGANRA